MNAAARAVPGRTRASSSSSGTTSAARARSAAASRARPSSAAPRNRSRGAHGGRVRRGGGPLRVDMGAVINRVQGIVERGANGARSYLESLPGLRLVMGEAAFEEPGVVVGQRRAHPGAARAHRDRQRGSRGRFRSPASTRRPYSPAPTSLLLRELPARLVVIGAGRGRAGAGPGACRAWVTRSRWSTWRRACSRRPNPGWATKLARLLREEGIELLLGARRRAHVRARRGRAEGDQVTVQYGAQRDDLDADAILLGAGRASSGRVAAPREGAGVEGGRQGRPVDSRLTDLAGRALRGGRRPRSAVRRLHPTPLAPLGRAAASKTRWAWTPTT